MLVVFCFSLVYLLNMRLLALLLVAFLPVVLLVGRVAVPGGFAPGALHGLLEKLVARLAVFLLATELAVPFVPVLLLALLATVHGDHALFAEVALLQMLGTVGALREHAVREAVVVAHFDQLVVPFRPALVNVVVGLVHGLFDCGFGETGGEPQRLDGEALLGCARVIRRVQSTCTNPCHYMCRL